MRSGNVFLFVCLKYALAIDYSFNELLVNSSISQATARIVQDFYVKEASAVVFTTGFINEPNRLRQSDVINNILQHSSNSFAKFRLQDFCQISSTYPEEFNLIFIDSYEGFTSVFQRMTPEIFDYTGLFTIVLTESYRDQYTIITRVLQDCWSLYITNVIVLATIEVKTRAAVYTYFPYTVHHCENVSPVISNYFIRNSFQYEVDFFPQKLKNMYKCPLHVATVQEIPYMFLIPQHNGSIYTDGIDGIIFRVLSQRLNFTPILIIPSAEEIEKEAPRQIGSSISIWMKLVHSGRANLTISAFAYTKDRAELLTASFPYFFSALLFTTPNGRPYTAFEKLFLPFKYIIWSCIGTSFGLGLITIFTLKFSSKRKREFLIGSHNPTPFLNMFSIFFGGSIQRPPTRNFARTLLCIWIFGCTVIRSAYQGAIFDFIKEAKNVPTLDTVSDLIQHDYPLYMSALTLNMFKFSPELREKIHTHNLTVEEKFMNLMEVNFKGAYVTTEAAVSYYNKQHATNATFFVRPTSDRVLLMPMCIYFRKHSCLTDAFNEQINLFTNSGLMSNWVSQFTQRKYLQAQPTTNQRSHQKLKLSHFSGTYLLCFGLICVTIFIFSLELLSHRICAIRKLVEFFE